LTTLKTISPVDGSVYCERENARASARIATELTWQISRPIRYAPNEVRGTLSRVGYEHLTRPKSYHLRLVT